MKTVVIPIVKNRTGDVSSLSNYRPISLATVFSKVLERLIQPHLHKYLNLNRSQFGFRAGLSTDTAIMTLKHTVKYYVKRRTSVYACFLDLSRAFDTINYNLLWKKLTACNVPSDIVDLLRYWYANQSNTVRWGDAFSEEYRLTCGVRQGGLTSPDLFNLYVNLLIEELNSAGVGCHIGQCSVNNLSYADDMVLLAPSVRGLRQLLSICEKYAVGHGLTYNVKKTEVVIFRYKQGPLNVPTLTLNGSQLRIVKKFKYLGHILTDDLRDDDDIERQRRCLAMKSNMLARRFHHCSVEAKITLFKSYCQSFYTSHLWSNYTKRAYNSLRVQYNNAFRCLLGLPWRCSASGMFAEYRVDDFYACMRKRVASFMNRIYNCDHEIINFIREQYDSEQFLHWAKFLMTTNT